MIEAPAQSQMDLNDCGCCEGIAVATPFEINNRPGLSAIAYRAGTQARFKASMIARLSESGLPELAHLKTRDNDDFTIALLDAWAVVCDVLTFYQERIANESYLLTATERASIINLTRLIGYELRPGVAANTYLAFTLETATGSPPTVAIDKGIRVQSIPGPGEKPQSFETIEEIEARGEWNEMKPRLTKLVLPASGHTSTYLEGVTTNLKLGDPLLVVGAERAADTNNENWEFRRVSAVEPDVANNRTLVRWAKPLSDRVPQADPSKATKIYALRSKASLFGFNAPAWNTLPVALRVGETAPAGAPAPVFRPGAYVDYLSKWADARFDAGTKIINLDSLYKQVVLDSWIVLVKPESTWDDGHERTLDDGKTPAPPFPPATELYQVKGVSEEAKAKFNISAKTTRLEISGENIEKFAPRDTTVEAQSEELPVAETPIAAPVYGKEIVLEQLITPLAEGRKIVVTGRRLGANEKDPMVSEVATIKSTEREDDTHSRLVLSAALSNVFDRATVTINANVALSTHGETVLNEVLGSGDAGQSYQRFNLRQAPLTYTGADTPSGGLTTLDVRVNDLKWKEVRTLFGHGPRERIYITHTDDDQKTTVQFGDGSTGARLPMGRENVQATYRKGIGLEGLAKASQLSLLMTRPLGIKGVINPLPATGAQDPQSLADARTNSPLTVLTLDRIVSLRDYEDFARSFSGIAKALATWTWNVHARGVFITVAGIGGAEVDEKLRDTLVSAMLKSSDSHVPVTIKSYRAITFKLGTDVKVDPDYAQVKVLTAVEAALRTGFSFAARTFGQPVPLSEVVSLIQNVAGVVAVDVNKLYRSDKPEALNTLLFAGAPRAGEDAGVPAAELLRLDPVPLELGVMP